MSTKAQNGSSPPYPNVARPCHQLEKQRIAIPTPGKNTDKEGTAEKVKEQIQGSPGMAHAAEILSLQPVYRSWSKPNAGLQVQRNEGTV